MFRNIWETTNQLNLTSCTFKWEQRYYELYVHSQTIKRIIAEECESCEKLLQNIEKLEDYGKAGLLS